VEGEAHYSGKGGGTVTSLVIISISLMITRSLPIIIIGPFVIGRQLGKLTPRMYIGYLLEGVAVAIIIGRLAGWW
jgi:hypothetical protein